MEEIFSSDYSEINRQRLIDWVQSKNTFDWTEICHWITNLEARLETPKDMQKLTREKMKAILEVCILKLPKIFVFKG